MSVIADFGVSGLFPSNVGGVGAAVKYFPRLLAPSIGAASLTPSATNATGQLVVKGLNQLNGQRFKVVACGDVLPFTGGINYNVLLQANVGTVAAPSYVTIASTSLITITSAAARGTWMLDVTLFGTSLGGALNGYYNSVTIAPSTGVGTQKGFGVLDSGVNGVNFNNAGAGNSVLSGSTGGSGTAGGNTSAVALVVGVQFGTSLAQNAASLYQFQVIAD